MFKHLCAFFALLLTVMPAQAAEEAGIDTAGKPAMACTQMWCQEGLTLDLNSDEWPAGDYYFAINLDGKLTNCKAKLPFKNCESNVTCNTKDVTIGESGCALPPEQHSFNAILSQQAPSDVAVAIRRADGKYFVWDNSPQKICTFPNGARCDERECCSVYSEINIVWETNQPQP